jgi:hypothetical protein
MVAVARGGPQDVRAAQRKHEGSREGAGGLCGVYLEVWSGARSAADLLASPVW